ncbi:MAG TPA: hypothetical protein VFH70_12635 [Acidimicrobiales bacterium]|nr:hypothetical protein [Acidimicrobiales bacterium]
MFALRTIYRYVNEQSVAHCTGGVNNHRPGGWGGRGDGGMGAGCPGGPAGLPAAGFA